MVHFKHLHTCYYTSELWSYQYCVFKIKTLLLNPVFIFQQDLLFNYVALEFSKHDCEQFVKISRGLEFVARFISQSFEENHKRLSSCFSCERVCKLTPFHTIWYVFTRLSEVTIDVWCNNLKSVIESTSKLNIWLASHHSQNAYLLL